MDGTLDCQVIAKRRNGERMFDLIDSRGRGLSHIYILPPRVPPVPRARDPLHDQRTSNGDPTLGWCAVQKRVPLVQKRPNNCTRGYVYVLDPPPALISTES